MTFCYRLWQLATCVILFLSIPVQAQENSRLISWSPDGTLLAIVDNTGVLHLWNANTLQPLLDIQSPVRSFDSVAWSPDGARIATNENLDNDGLRIWDTGNGQLLAHYEEIGDPNGGKGLVTWSPDGTKLATAQTTSSATFLIYIWSGADDKYNLLSTITDAGQQLFNIEWSSDSLHLAASGFAGLYIVDILAAETHESHYITLPYGVFNAAWSPDGNQLAVSSLFPSRSGFDDNVRILDVHTMKDIQVLPVSSPAVLSWNLAGDKLAVGSNTSVTLWDVTTGRILETLPAISPSFSWSPFGGRLAYLGNVDPNASERTQTFSGTLAHIVVPAPSRNLLEAIISVCVPAAKQTQLMSEITTSAPSDLVSTLNGLMDANISPACASDLVSVANALQSK